MKFFQETQSIHGDSNKSFWIRIPQRSLQQFKRSLRTEKFFWQKFSMSDKVKILALATIHTILANYCTILMKILVRAIQIWCYRLNKILIFSNLTTRCHRKRAIKNFREFISQERYIRIST